MRNLPVLSTPPCIQSGTPVRRSFNFLVPSNWEGSTILFEVLATRVSGPSPEQPFGTCSMHLSLAPHSRQVKVTFSDGENG